MTKSIATVKAILSTVKRAIKLKQYSVTKVIYRYM